MLKNVLVAAVAIGLWVAVPAFAQTGSTQEGAKKVGEAGKQTGESAKELGKTTGEAAKDASKDAGETAKGVGKDTADAAKDVGKDVGDTAKKTGKKIKNRVLGKVTATCGDGTTQTGKTAAAACTDHGGVKAAAAK